MIVNTNNEILHYIQSLSDDVLSMHIAFGLDWEIKKKTFWQRFLTLYSNADYYTKAPGKYWDPTGTIPNYVKDYNNVRNIIIEKNNQGGINSTFRHHYIYNLGVLSSRETNNKNILDSAINASIRLRAEALLVTLLDLGYTSPEDIYDKVNRVIGKK